MSDFLDRFGDELSTAQARATQVQQADESRSVRSTLRKRRKIVLWALGASLAVAAPALAITTPWRPSLERSGIDQPVSASNSAVSDSVRERFGVLRRAQTDADRERTTSVLHAIGAGNQVDDVQTNGIRSVASGWALVPAKSLQTAPGHRSSEDVLCLTDGETVGCAPTSSAATNGVGMLSASSTETSIAGLVPDGVSAARFIPLGGKAITAAVASNFFSLHASQIAPASTIKAPPGYQGRSEIPGPPMPVEGTMQWLDDGGNVIGPVQQTVGR